MKFLLCQPNSNPWHPATICAIGTLADCQAKKKPGQHVVACLHEGIYRYEVGGPVMYDLYPLSFGVLGADGSTVYVDTSGT